MKSIKCLLPVMRSVLIVMSTPNCADTKIFSEGGVDSSELQKMKVRKTTTTTKGKKFLA